MANALSSWQFRAFFSAVFAALTAIFGVVFLSEKLSFENWLGVCLIAIGALLVAMK